ncbi:MAG: hypothetical protein QOI40_2297 [Alphaproteobacteria bacterium]|nr:hypothetical protein [Alphaproteobacteria bacterium]
MSKPPAEFAGLEDLLDLGHGEGIDMRPTLLRVLTDLYLQRRTHTPEDERYYTELALRLIDATDVAQRAALAARLASYPSAPREVLLRLAHDTIEVAAAILEHSPCLTPADLAAIANERGAAHADIIATRPAAASPAAQARAAGGRTSARAEASELSELFYAAGAAERRLILINLDYAVLAPLPPLSGMPRPDVWRLESAALQHNTETVMRELEHTLGLARAQTRRIVSDELGEPIVVAAKAMNLPADVLQRMLLFMNPSVGQSIDRVYALAELYREISEDAALRLVAIWRDAEEPDDEVGRQEPVTWRTAAENARRALSEVSRRPALQQTPRLRGRVGVETGFPPQTAANNES